MGKTLSRDQRKHNKYIMRENNRKLKEQQHMIQPLDEDSQKEKPRKKWRPRSEIDVD